MSDMEKKKVFTLTPREAAWILGITEPGLAYKRKNDQGPTVHSETGQTTYCENGVLQYLENQIKGAQVDFDNGKARLDQIKDQRPKQD